MPVLNGREVVVVESYLQNYHQHRLTNIYRLNSYTVHFTLFSSMHKGQIVERFCCDYCFILT